MRFFLFSWLLRIYWVSWYNLHILSRSYTYNAGTHGMRFAWSLTVENPKSMLLLYIFSSVQRLSESPFTLTASHTNLCSAWVCRCPVILRWNPVDVHSAHNARSLCVFVIQLELSIRSVILDWKYRKQKKKKTDLLMIVLKTDGRRERSDPQRFSGTNTQYEYERESSSKTTAHWMERKIIYSIIKRKKHR